jgi:hypothetical protein
MTSYKVVQDFQGPGAWGLICAPQSTWVCGTACLCFQPHGIDLGYNVHEVYPSRASKMQIQDIASFEIRQIYKARFAEGTGKSDHEVELDICKTPRAVLRLLSFGYRTLVIFGRQGDLLAPGVSRELLYDKIESIIHNQHKRDTPQHHVTASSNFSRAQIIIRRITSFL